MKLILCMLFLVITAKECDKNKAQLNTGNTLETTMPSERKMQDSVKITYQAATRGFYMKIWVQGDSIMISEDNREQKFKTYVFPKEEKEAFLKSLNEIDTTSLTDLKAPSTTFQYDAAPMAWLEIANGDEIHRTNAFDHGKPPKPIKDLVDKMILVKTMVEKQ